MIAEHDLLVVRRGNLALVVLGEEVLRVGDPLATPRLHRRTLACGAGRRRRRGRRSAASGRVLRRGCACDALVPFGAAFI